MAAESDCRNCEYVLLDESLSQGDTTISPNERGIDFEKLVRFCPIMKATIKAELDMTMGCGIAAAAILGLHENTNNEVADKLIQNCDRDMEVENVEAQHA